jgi:hypothetical protein
LASENLRRQIEQHPDLQAYPSPNSEDQIILNIAAYICAGHEFRVFWKNDCHKISICDMKYFIMQLEKNRKTLRNNVLCRPSFVAQELRAYSKSNTEIKFSNASP